MPTLTKDQVIQGTSREVQWWLDNRLNKFRDLSHETMSINPFMAPVIMALHSQLAFTELAELLLGGHFMTGHATGFGKLIDEKILPKLFGSRKLDAAFRRTPPYEMSVFSEIDHMIGVANDEPVYLSLKASRWTIQLTMAEKMNTAFTKLIRMRGDGTIKFKKIVVGVFYGTQEALTDKFSIIRGICSGAQHDVTDITEHVEVVAGKQFWAWINGGQQDTQDWIMQGVLDAVTASRAKLTTAKGLLEEYKRTFGDSFSQYVDGEGKIDWFGILHSING
jgi:hypothetical protein